MSISDYDNDIGRGCTNVEVIMPHLEGAPHSSVGSDAAATTASSATLDVASLVERAVAKLPPDLAAQAVDIKRKARSQDPGWKYGWWPDPSKKDFVQCIFCKKVVPSGIKRFKQHLAGGYGDAVGCPSCPEIVRKEMAAYLKKNSRILVVNHTLGEDEEEQDAAAAEEPAAEAVPTPSSGTKVKQAKKKIAQAAITSFTVSAAAKPGTQKQSRSVSSMLCKSPEVVSERHRSKQSQSTLEQCTKKSKEDRVIIDDHVADFFYENRIPLNVINSRSWEVLVESIGQYGPGYRPPSYHDIRVPLLQKAVNRTSELRTKHEEAWKEYGCSIMSDGWTQKRKEINSHNSCGCGRVGCSCCPCCCCCSCFYHWMGRRQCPCSHWLAVIDFCMDHDSSTTGGKPSYLTLCVLVDLFK